jgi:hypothetical protein
MSVFVRRGGSRTAHARGGPQGTSAETKTLAQRERGDRMAEGAPRSARRGGEGGKGVAEGRGRVRGYFRARPAFTEGQQEPADDIGCNGCSPLNI